MFEKGYFWEYYLDLERQFIDFLHYVPYLDGNEKVYSFRLANLLLAIGAHVDSALKEVFRINESLPNYHEVIQKIDNGKAKFFDYYPIAEKYHLSKRKVEFKRLPNSEIIYPFQEYIRHKDRITTPSWWTTYNKVKHKFSENFERANLINARNSLAGAFLINVVNKSAIKKLMLIGAAKWLRQDIDTHQDFAIIEERNRIDKLWVLEDILKTSIYPPLYVETAVFFFNCERV